MNRRNFLKALSIAPLAVAMPKILYSQPIDKPTLLEAKSPNGYAVFEFENGLPDDWEIAVTWMNEQWKEGYKFLYPEWGQ